MNSFVLDEEAARDWVTGLIVSYELAGLDDGGDMAPWSPRLGMGWEPREPGQEETVAALIEHAHRAGVLDRPERTTVSIEFIDDGDDWCYRFLLDIGSPRPLTIASAPATIRRLGDDLVVGADAAVAVLREAARTADDLLGRLETFVRVAAARRGWLPTLRGPE